MYRFLLRYTGLFALLFLQTWAMGQTILMQEGFESGALPDGWTQVYTSAPNTDWIYQNGGFPYSSASFEYERTPSAANSGSYNAVFHSDISSETMLVSPRFDLSNNEVKKLEYYHTQGCFFNQALNIYYREGLYGPWNLLRSNNSVVFSWSKDSLIIPSVADSVYFAFQGIWDGGCGVCLDDIKLLSLKPYTATFVVKDPAGSPIQGAIVTFNEITKITDATGTAVFTKVYEGQGFGYNVRKNGKAPEAGKMTISADVVKNITLWPSRIIYVSKSPKTAKHNGSNWDSAYVKLEDALADAKKGDQIWVSRGVYYPSQQWNVSTARALSIAMKKEVAIFGGFSGITGTEGDISSQDIDIHKTVFSGDIDRNDITDADGITTAIVGSNALFVIFNNANELDNTSILNGVYITGGDASLGSYRWGSAIYNQKSSPTIFNCRIVGNRSSGGAAVYNNLCSPQFFNTDCSNNIGGGLQNVYAPAVIDRCRFESNTSYGMSNYYSDMHIKQSAFAANGTDGIINETSQVVFTKCQFDDNTKSGAHTIYGANAQFDSCTFIGNHSFGLLAENSSVSMDSCSLAKNTISGISIIDPSAAEILQVTNSSFASNGDGSINGGGISADGLNKLILFSNDFRHNKGQDGGALYVHNAQTAKITNAVFWNNSASQGSGAYFKSCLPSLYQISVAANISSSGGALCADGATVDMRNAIVWGNSHASSEPLSVLNAGQFSADHSCIEGGYASGTDIMTADPVFIDITSGELRHKGYSPVIDAGAEAGVMYDILGHPRPLPVGGATDMGAYERYVGIDVVGGFPVDNQDVVGLFSQFKLKFNENIAKGLSGATIRLYYGNVLHEQFDVASQVQIVGDTAFFTATKALKYGDYYIEISRDAFIGAVSGMGYYGTVSPAELNFTIHRPQIYVSPLATGSATGYDWKNAFTTVQEALASAVAGQQIWISAGTFIPSKTSGGTTSNHRCFTLKDSVSVLGGFSGIPGTEGLLSSRNTKKYATIFSGDIQGNDNGTPASLSDNAWHIIRNIAADGQGLTAGFTLSGIRFMGGNASGSGELAQGAAIYADGCSLSIDSCSFTANTATDNIICLKGTTGSELIDARSLQFSDNTGSYLISASNNSLALSDISATGNAAGFVSSSNTKLTGKNASIRRNTGNVFFQLSSGESRLQNIVFAQNTGNSGFATYNDATLGIDHLTSAENTLGGSTVEASALSALSITNSIIWDNSLSAISTGSASETIDNNIIKGGDPRGANNRDLNPQFYDPAAGNFAVIELSPAIDHAVASTATEDIRGLARPQGPHADLGAYERKSGPYIIASDPADNYFGGRKNSFTLQFSENIAALTGSLYIKHFASGTVVQKIDVAQLAISADKATFTISSNVNFGKYYLTIDSAAIVGALDHERVFDGIKSNSVLDFEFHNSIKYVDKDATGDNNGTSWQHAYVRLQDAIDACIEGDNIWIAEGVYLPTKRSDISDDRSYSFLLKNGVQIFGGFSAQDDVFANRNTELYPVILSGDLDANDIAGADTYTTIGANAYHVIVGDNAGLGRFTAINGCTVQGGAADGTAAQHQSGGGLYLHADSLLLENMIFKGNTAIQQGGAIHTDAFLHITSSLFSNNEAANGGAVSFAPVAESAIIIRNATFAGNKASQKGGALHLANASAGSELFGIKINNNNANAGSAISLIHAANPVFANILIHHNAADQNASIVNESGNARFVNMTLVANTGNANAGIESLVSGTATVQNSILWANMSTGGDANYAVSGAASIVFDHTTVGNADPSILAVNMNDAADPRFVDMAAHNYLLQQCSPAVDAGINTAIASLISTDLADKTRISDGNADGVPVVDRGAFEWDGACHWAACPVKYDACWTGCAGSDWFDTTNWTTGAVPSASTSVFVPGSSVVCYQPLIIGKSAWCKSIDIDSDGSALLQIDTDNAGKLNISQ